jgi:hypothetical protein
VIVRRLIAALRAVDDRPGPPTAGVGLPFSTGQLRELRDAQRR